MEFRWDPAAELGTSWGGCPGQRVLGIGGCELSRVFRPDTKAAAQCLRKSSSSRQRSRCCTPYRLPSRLRSHPLLTEPLEASVLLFGLAHLGKARQQDVKTPAPRAQRDLRAEGAITITAQGTALGRQVKLTRQPEGLPENSICQSTLNPDVTLFRTVALSSKYRHVRRQRGAYREAFQASSSLSFLSPGLRPGLLSRCAFGAKILAAPVEA